MITYMGQECPYHKGLLCQEASGCKNCLVAERGKATSGNITARVDIVIEPLFAALLEDDGELD